MNHASAPIRLLGDLLVLIVLAWLELGRLRELLANAVAPER